MSNPTGNGAGEGQKRFAVVTLTYDLDTFQLTVGGTCPTTQFAKALCLMGADECEQQLEAKRMRQRLAIAGPELLAQLQHRG